MKNLSRAAQLYIMGTVLVGGLGAIWFLSSFERTSPFALIVACVLATLLQIFKIEGSTARTSYNLSWVVYGAAFAGLGGPEMLITILVAHLGEWIWHRYPWYIQSFNMAAFAITSILAGLAYDLLLSIPIDFFGIRNAFAILVAMLVFTGVNHLMVGFVIKWARGQSLSQSGVFTLSTLTIDFGLLCLGASAAIVAQVNPAAIVFIVIVAYLVQSALRVPALERKSEQDSKTGLYNAQHFDQAVQKELARAQKQNRPITVVMADLDKLRDLNNTYGHLAGDIVLKKIAQILQALARDGDVISRFGGEEFGILLPDTTTDEAFIQIEAMRKAIEAAEFTITTRDTPIKATMSFGVAGRIGSKQNAKEFIHLADVAVYHAKHTGRNRVCIYQPNYDSLSKEIAATISVTGKNTATPQEAEKQAMPKPLPATHRDPHLDPEAETTSIALTVIPESVVPEIAVANTTPLPQPTDPTQSPTTEPPTPTPNQRDRWMQIYIGSMAVGAVALIFATAYALPMPTIDWTGLFVFMLLALTLELVATEIYSRDASVSTSVAPIIGAMMAFGIIGAALTALMVAGITQFRTKKPINRIIFNTSNHLISSTLCLLLLRFSPIPLLEWPLPLQALFAILASIVIYLSSTGFLAGILALSTGQSFIDIWQEKFKWLGLHYIALGAVAFVLFYSYVTVGTFSVIILLVPLAMLHFGQYQYIKATQSMVDQLNANNQTLTNRNQEVQRLNDELLLALASTIDLRDPFVVEHSRHVARYAAIIAQELGLTQPQIHLVYQAGLIHDIGKLAIPEAILFKPGRLTQDEYEVIKEHVTVGADLLNDFQSLQSVATFVRYHHERYDGRGYPDGLKGDEIPLEARILALSDAVEAMASDRPYRRGSTVAAILKEIQNEAGSQFDPSVVQAFVTVVQREGDATIINSARNIELPELKSNAAMREDFALWTTPKTSSPTPNVGSFNPSQIVPKTSA